jgi:putative transposase
MSRPPRLWAPELPFHLIIRGNDRQPIFRSEGDRIFFHRCLAETSTRLGLRVHAYVLMSNHVHLLATGDHRQAAAKTIQSLGRRYVRYFNYLHVRTGTLWEGRYRACPVETDRYFLTCHRYIESNPVRAGMVTDAAGFAWSSHRHYALGVGDSLITPHGLIATLGRDAASRRIAYRRLFDKPLDAKELQFIRDCINHGRPIGEVKLEGGRTIERGKPGSKPAGRRFARVE